MATPGLDGLLIVWDISSGKPIRVVRHGGPLVSAAFSPDAEMVACAFASPTGPDAALAYPPLEEYGADPLPRALDESLGDYDDSTEWGDAELPEGAVVPIGIAEISTGEWVASFYASEIRSPVEDLLWSRDGRTIVSASLDGVATWQTRTGQLLEVRSAILGASLDTPLDESALGVAGPWDWVRISRDSGKRQTSDLDTEISWGEGDEAYTTIACSRNYTAVGTSFGTIHVIRRDDVSQELEGHTKAITSLSISSDERLLASKSLDGTVRLWDCTTWESISILKEPARGQADNAGIAFAPSGHVLATLGPAGKVVRVWHLDLGTILARREIAPTVHYSNAKVVLIGDSGVGKTGLGLVLAGEEFRPTESSHRRNVWLLETHDFEGQQPERRETYLWDLAGQPGYRLLHQLHLGDAAVAVVLFDAKSESDPFAGVRHWVKALRQAERHGRHKPKRLLVAARMDRGGPQVSEERLQEAKRDFGFDRYMETSAKEGRGVDELHEAITALVEWEVMPKVSSTGLFDSIKAFLVAERDQDRLLVSARDLREAYARTRNGRDAEEITAEFETCIGRVAARGLIRRLSFGGLVLLRPEVLDAYAASLTMAAREQPDGMGSINEEAARQGEYAIPEEDRLSDPELERLLLTATVEEVLRHEVALREHSEDGPYLVFPTQSRRQAPPLEGSHKVWLSVHFEGQVQTVYATLVVRLAHSGLFQRKATYRNAATFIARDAELGVSVEEPKEGSGVLRLFAAGDADRRAMEWFADYVVAHVRRRAVESSIRIDDAITCGGCGLEITASILDAARERGRDTITCPICDTKVDVSVRFDTDINVLVVKQMDDHADEERKRAAAAAALHGKEEVGDFDVFLAHNSEDKEAVVRIGESLRSYGLNPWIDDEQVPPGRWFQDYIEQAMGMVGSAAIIIGKAGLGRWQAVELKAFIEECIEHELPVIPVLLPGGSIPKELRVLRQLSWVRFKNNVDEAAGIERLRWGITGKRSSIIVH